MKLAAVIFDFDEVVIYSYSDHARSFVKACRKFGLKVTERQIYERFGKSAINILSEIFPRMTSQELLRVKIEKDKEYMRIISTKKIRTIDGIRNLLMFLRNNGIKAGIASSAARRNVFIGLRRTKLRRYFNAIVASEDVKRHKPHPDSLLKAAKMLRAKPAHCIYVGDSVYEMIAAKRAKMYGYGVTTGFYSKSQLMSKGAKKVFRNHLGIVADLKKNLVS